MSAVAVDIEAVDEVTSELVGALASLLPQLNAASVGPSHDELSALLADPAITLLTARDESVIVAAATVVVYTTAVGVRARIEDVVVDEASLGHGIGEALLKECVNIARQRGARVVDLHLARGREGRANRLYVRLGFERRHGHSYRIVLDQGSTVTT